MACRCALAQGQGVGFRAILRMCGRLSVGGSAAGMWSVVQLEAFGAAH